MGQRKVPSGSIGPKTQLFPQFLTIWGFAGPGSSHKPRKQLVGNAFLKLHVHGKCEGLGVLDCRELASAAQMPVPEPHAALNE
eukprot:5223553-Amphidinium_carterae.1